MICYVLAMEKQHLGPHVVVGYSINIFWPGLFITSPDHLEYLARERNTMSWPGLEPRALAQELSALTMRSTHLPQKEYLT